MPRRMRSFTGTVAVASGLGEDDLSKFHPIRDAGGFIKEIIVNAPSSESLYNCFIVNENDRAVYRLRNQTGESIELMELPLVGSCKIVINNASEDGSYTYELMFFENS